MVRILNISLMPRNIMIHLVRKPSIKKLLWIFSPSLWREPGLAEMSEAFMGTGRISCYARRIFRQDFSSNHLRK
jgi:hypothetical protein